LAKDLLDEVHYLVEAEDRAFIKKDSSCAIQNYIEQASWLEYAGVGFGEDRNLLIQKAMKRLAKASGASKIKFFGKIGCTE
jgi:hypothetical protein